MVGDSTTVLLYKAMRAAAARPAGSDRAGAGPRPVPDRPVRRGRGGPRVRADAALDRRRHRRRGDGRPAGRRGGSADRARRAQPRRVPLGLAGRGRRAHRDRARRRRAGAVGPVPLGRRGPGRAGRVGRRPGGRLHLQVPQRRTRLAGVPVRRRAAARRADPADPGLDGRRGPVPDGPDLRARGRDPAVPVRHAADARDAGDPGHGGAARRGRDRRRPARSRWR